MKRLYYILVLCLISTVYLFPQTEGNEIVKIKRDTVIKVDTIVVIKIDTIVVAKSVSKQEEKTDLSNYIYKNHIKTHDILAIDDSKKTGIISAKLGSLVFFNFGSITWDIPITRKLDFAAKGFYQIGLSNNPASGFGLGLGYVRRYVNDDIIIKGNIYPTLGLGITKNEIRFGLNLGGDIIFSNIFSIGLDLIAFERYIIPLYTIGLNIVY